ncbi:hypothetical protein PLCT2_02873 [Planctomycetaceae bacterium]|nr:hypothetical protein PLCT2_02873 [Planctomycetaceae bacterium]
MKRALVLLCLLLAACSSSKRHALSGGAPQNAPAAKVEEPAPSQTFEEVRDEAQRLMLSEKWAEALPLFLRAAQLTSDPHDELYNIACCNARLGNSQLAVEYLWKAFDAGVNQYPFVQADPDLFSLIGFAPFERFMEKLKETYEAWEKSRGTELFVEAPVLHEVRVRLPENYDKSKQYPLVIGLHEYGGNAAEFAALYFDISYKSEFIFAAINGPYAVQTIDQNPGGRWWWLHGTPDDGWMRSRAAMVQTVLAVRKRMCQQYSIEEDNIYLLGYRQGGTAAMLVCSTEASQFAGFIAIGAHHLGDSPKVPTGFAVLLCHARDDEKLAFDFCEEAQEVWVKAGAEVSIEELIEWREIGADTTNAIAAWLFTQIDAHSED